MKRRHLTQNFVNQLLTGSYQDIIQLVKDDDTIDMEMRGDSVIVYYRGGKLFELNEKGALSPLDAKYGKPNVTLDISNIESYCLQAKHLVDKYQTNTKNTLGEKEISQRIIMENNYSPYSYDTDYFIIDMEFNDGCQFDLVALKWESTSIAHKNKKCQIALIETKQGYQTLRSTDDNPGICRHYSDYEEFIKKIDINDFKNDMLEVFKQKCILGLIRGINNNSGLQVNNLTEFNLINEIEFIVVLANCKPASKNLENELKDMPENNNCKFSIPSFMGYGLFYKYILSFQDFKKSFL